MSILAPTRPRPLRQSAVALAAVGAGLLALTALLALGPRPLNPVEEFNGDPALAARLSELAEPGHHRIAAFTIHDGETTVAGLGAGEDLEFEIGSITKTFTAEILRNQIAAGRVTEETTVGEILNVTGAPVADVTLGELADHTSGLPRLAGIGLFRTLTSALLGTNPYEGITGDDLIDAALNSGLSRRGEEHYSNLGVGLLGQLLAAEADTTYEALVQEQILGPLGMTDTYVMTGGSVPPTAPRGHLPSGRVAQPWEMGGYNPAGGIRSTAADMARFAEHLLADGLPDYTWAESDTGYHWHNGATYGYSAMLIIDADDGRAAFAVGDTAGPLEDLTAALLRAEG